MNGLMLVGLAIVVFVAAYIGYGRWLVNTWGIDPKAKTPAVALEDGQDFAPASRFTVFSHQFSSITGAGPVTGPIIAAMFGWAPALLWLLFGGVFFGAVQDFTALYASVKNQGKSMGMLIEQYVGKTGRRLFLLFCWLFTLLVLAAFADIIANTFNGLTKTGELNIPGAQAASISMLYIFVAMGFGCFIRKFNPSGPLKLLVAVVLVIAMFAVGMAFPLYFDAQTWRYVTFGYCFIASVLPMWLLMEPRDYMTTFMLLGMIIGAVVGVIAEHPTMKLNAFSGFNVDGSYLFPTLFVTIACGAVSGFHSLVSSGTSSKTISNEKDMPMVGYGAMVVESLLGVIALVVVGAVAVNGTKPEGTPFSIFSAGVAGFFEKFGIPVQVATVFMTMCVSALALTSLDSVARIGRMSFQELFYGDSTDPADMTPVQRVLTNKYFATIITLFFGYLLTLGGYNNIWPLFGSANQLLAALVLIALAVFLKTTGRTGWTLYIPMFVMLAVTFTALIQKTIALVSNIAGGQATFLVDGLQFIVAILLMVLGVLVAFSCLKKLFTAKKQEA